MMSLRGLGNPGTGGRIKFQDPRIVKTISPIRGRANNHHYRGEKNE